MKSTIKSLLAALVVALSCASCGGGVFPANGAATTTSNGSILGNVLGAVTNGDALGNILGSVLGTNKMTEESIVGTWHYAQPGVAFTSDKLLAQAGGEVVASQVKQKLATYYNGVGIKSSNTYFTFNSDKTFTGKLLGTSVSGQWAYNASTSALTLQTMLFTLNANVTGTTTGMSILFESKKLLTVLQTIGAASGNTTIQGISSISSNYSGIRLGFDMSK